MFGPAGTSAGPAPLLLPAVGQAGPEAPLWLQLPPLPARAQGNRKDPPQAAPQGTPDSTGVTPGLTGGLD